MAETARGVLAAREIAESSPRLRTFIFGPADLGKELGVEPTADGFEHLHARSAIVLAARAAGKEGPVDGPYLKLDDDEGCAVSSAWARRLGFQGKVVLHPRQLPIAAAAFAPGERELAWAREVDRAFAEAEAAWRLLDQARRRDVRRLPRGSSAPATSCVRATAEHRILRAMKVERIRKAYEQVADQLLAMINSGELKPGDRLPSEAELAADFGVSRTTVREALRILATRNLIHTRKGMAGGHFIVEPTVGSISEFLVANYGLLTAANTVTLEHLLQAREMIEGPAAAIAARNRDDDRSREARSRASATTSRRSARPMRWRSSATSTSSCSRRPRTSCSSWPPRRSSPCCSRRSSAGARPRR